MLSTSSLPDQPTPPASQPEGAPGHFDRMEVQLKALQQQALATQASLKQLQARDAKQSSVGALPDLPTFPGVDGAPLGVATLLLLAFAMLWWYLWHRPKLRLTESPHTLMPDIAMVSEYGPSSMPEAEAPAAVLKPPSASASASASTSPSSASAVAPPPQPTAVLTAARDEWSVDSGWGDLVSIDPQIGPFAKASPAREFDREAAASEVLRVRKSLANKREARAQFLEREDAPNIEPIPPSVRAWLDGGAPARSADKAQSHPATAQTVDQSPEPPEEQAPVDEPPRATVEAVSFSLPLETAEMAASSAPAAIPALVPAETPDATLEATPEAIPEAKPDTEGPMEHDYTITLALALESEALDLWPEARELAHEVMESTDAALRAQAQALLSRLDQLGRQLARASSAWDRSV